MDASLRASTSTWAGPGARARARARGTRPPGVGERLGVYAVKELLGEGGMARVYLAEHTVVERRVAIKRLLPELGHIPEAHAMLLREARTAGAVRHPNLLEIYDFGYDPDGRPYVVMELAGGGTVAERLRHGPLLVSQALDLAIGVTDALAAVHAAGYLHRDIKAENVMLSRDDRRLVPKLIDFGVACRVDEGAAGVADPHVVGTPRMMAPEQVARDRIDARTDVWGIGGLLYEMLAGYPPLSPRGSAREDMLAIVTEPVRPLPGHLHPEVRAVVAACLGKDPDDRPPSAAALGARLRAAQAAYLAARGMIRRAPGLPLRTREWGA